MLWDDVWYRNQSLFWCRRYCVFHEKSRRKLPMNRTITALLLQLTASFLLSSGAEAQNLVISNARIIAGPGQVIEKGAVVIQDGKVASVTAGAAPAAPQGAKVID